MLPGYLARLAYAVGDGALRGRVPPLAEVRLPLRVWPDDVDFYLHVNNGRYLTLMDLGRFQLAARTGLLELMVRRSVWPVLGGVAVSFRRELRLFERFDLTTRFVAWDGKWFYVEQRLERGPHVHAVALNAGRLPPPRPDRAVRGARARARVRRAAAPRPGRVRVHRAGAPGALPLGVSR
jgi:acyl-CoA thioesterase FadM